MTEAEVARASDLIFARTEIQQYLACADKDSEWLKHYYKDDTDSIARIGRAKWANFTTCTGKHPYDDNSEELINWCMRRDILERALGAELVRVGQELEALGVKL